MFLVDVAEIYVDERFFGVVLENFRRFAEFGSYFGIGIGDYLGISNVFDKSVDYSRS